MKYNVGIVSLGCAKNQTDTETMLGLLAEDGHRIVADPAEADIIIVNTCGFIVPAKQESIDTLLEMAEYKKNRCRVLIAAGCLAERYREEIMRELPEVDAVVGTGDYDRIAEVVAEAARGGHPALWGHQERDMEPGLPRMLTTPPYTAYLKIAEGCDNRCTYCAIPLIRGRFRSRPIEELVSEACELAASGVTELIVIAQDTTRYGVDIYGKYSLDRLLCELDKIEGLHWIRVHYFYTEAVTAGLIETMAKSRKILPYIDMPIQHASDDILRRMARRTNKAQIKSVIAQIREKMPEAVIRTSMIVGFPGETEEQFRELCDFCEEMRFDRMGVFAYSQEEGTPAAGFAGQIPEEIKEKRLDTLMRLQQGISNELNEARIGSVVEVLAEGYDEESYLYYGRSRGDSIDVDGRVYFGAEREVSPGEYVRVKILAADEYDLSGALEEDV